MTDVLFSDQELEQHRSCPKRVKNPGARWTDKPGHKQRNFNVVSASDDNIRFRLYLRQNLADENDFSCGLALIQPGGKSLSLIRYNGPSHPHGVIAYRCHIHNAAADALHSGKKIDSHAEETKRYRTLEGALACLVQDCGIQGLKANHDSGDLFDGS